ncbi:unnamed protein product [Mytilus edulis]|uniref:NTR domain-containing protein n=2 Tax=Mytilus edulis TaxID=6550 RepID=A0A8S3R3W0_MYTED|nr:unnamed protein product [Mytilus edulis]
MRTEEGSHLHHPKLIIVCILNNLSLHHRITCILFITSEIRRQKMAAIVCELRHPQQQYCESDFVVLAGILDKDVIYHKEGFPMAIHYIVNIKKVFKAGPEYENATKTMIISSTSGSGVGELEMDVNYVITGTIMDDNLYTSICEWVKPYHNLTKAQKNGLRFKYDSGCQCEFSFCREGQCGQLDSNNTCEWEFGIMFDCYHDDGICFHNGEECFWRETRKFRQCEDNIYLGDQKFTNEVIPDPM